jgi:hypothetical protein
MTRGVGPLVEVICACGVNSKDTTAALLPFLQAPVFLGAQLHTLRARVYFCLKMGRGMLELKHDLLTFLLRKKCSPT